MIRELVKQSAISLPFVFALAKRAEILAQRFSGRPHESDRAAYGYERFSFDGQSLLSALRDTLNVFFAPQAGKARAGCEGGHVH